MLISQEFEVIQEELNSSLNGGLDVVSMTCTQLNMKMMEELNNIFPIEIENNHIRRTTLFRRKFVVMTEDEFRNFAKLTKIQQEIDNFENERKDAVEERDFHYAFYMKAMIEGLRKAKKILLE